MSRINISTGSKWEELAGYCRVVRVGNIIEVAGTVAVDEKGEVVGANDVVAQTKFIFEKIDKSLQQANSSLKDVTRTRMFITDIRQWEGVTKMHGQFFKDIRPVCTLVEVSKLIQPELLIEIEVSAVATN